MSFRPGFALRSIRARRRPLVAIAAAVALVAGVALVVSTVPAGAATTLLSQGRPATASSSEGAGTPASAAVDGNAGTRWSSAFSDPQWIVVDLGGSRTVCGVDLTWEAAHAKAFSLQTSPDGATWTTVYSTTSGAGGTQHLAVSGTGRYLRLYGTARATTYGYSLYELGVRTTGDTGSTPTPSVTPSSTPTPTGTPPVVKKGAALWNFAG